MGGTSLCSRFLLRIWTDATSSSGVIGSLLSVQHISPLGFCGLLKRTLIGYLFIICLCLIFAGDVESDTSRVLRVVDDSDTNEIATRAGFLNASQVGSIEAFQAGPCNVENINCHHEPVVSDGEFAPQQREHNNIDAVQPWYIDGGP